MEYNSTHTLLADSIRLSLGNRTILNGGWLTCSTNEVIGVLGRNGSGKSCMFRTIMGELRAEEIFVKVDDKIVTGNPKIGNYIQYLSQKRFLPSKLTLETIFNLYNSDFEEFAEYFPNFEKLYHSKVCELSGGEIRIVEVWLVLNSDAPFAILDEPVAQLSPIAIEQVEKIILLKKRGKGIIISDHNYETILRLSDKVLLLWEGYVTRVKEREDLIRCGYIRF